ncbi:MAG: YggS family pyridoxal phosphate-dependent enzyme [Planctomycetes bacterium]|nr:YggS family pyridoxal phosphate-dependent enzyme [Planctomycetota bacterium]
MININQQLAENLARVRLRIQSAAEAARRDANDVQLVAVTKYVDASITASLLAAGCSVLGESRPQQLWDKAAQPELAKAQWHLIGHLQRNKVQRTLPLVDLIHSVDSERLLASINNAAIGQDRCARVLLEVNCSGDESKHGLSADGLKEIVPLLANFSSVEVCGLMTMAAREGGPTAAARNFATLRELRDQVALNCPPNVNLTELSMGMSHDFEVAIREGATLVRVGSLLFEGLRG